MKQFLSEVKEFPELTQCHRAYTINIHNVSYYEGTSRKGELHFQDRKDTITVSRNYSKIITDALDTNWKKSNFARKNRQFRINAHIDNSNENHIKTSPGGYRRPHGNWFRSVSVRRMEDVR